MVLTCAKECGLGSTLQVLVLTATLPSPILSNAVLRDLVPAREMRSSNLEVGDRTAFADFRISSAMGSRSLSWTTGSI